MSSKHASSDVLNILENMLNSVKTQNQVIKDMITKDSDLEGIELDEESLNTTRLYAKYNRMFADEQNEYYDLLDLKKQYKLERWKYWRGSQTTAYYKEHGIVHEEINKTDVERYLDADPIMSLVNKMTGIQKSTVDMIERMVKDIGQRGFQIKTILEYRKFISASF